MGTINGLPGNPHFNEADYNNDNFALSQAVLALAFEQRTATLTALLVASETSVQIAGIDYSELADEIKLRIGAVKK